MRPRPTAVTATWPTIWGAAPRPRCSVCDQLRRVSSRLHDRRQADRFAAHARIVLAALGEQSWGRRTWSGCCAAMRRRRPCPAVPLFWRAPHAQEQCLGQLIDSLLQEGLISKRGAGPRRRDAGIDQARARCAGKV